MDSPCISFVMSVYNGQTFLAQAIESVLGQTLPDFEFVIIDDGSADKTAGILAGYARQDKRVKVFRHENRGRAESLNVGIRLSTGDYIARMDADDVALPHRLEQQLEFMERHPEVGLLGGAVEFIYSGGQVFNTYRPPLDDPNIRHLMLARNAFFHPTAMMRKEVILASGGYRKALLDADDYDLFLRMGDRSQFANLADVVLQYRVHAGQVSVRNMRHQALCVLAARAAAAQRKQGRPDPLSQINEVTPHLLETLGVTKDETRRALLAVYTDWIQVFEHTQPEAALQAIEGLLQLSSSEFVERSVLANAWLSAAEIHRGQGRLVKAMASLGQAVLARPIIAGRPIKRAFERFIAGPKSRSTETK
jgi:hypothetical protein